MAGDANYIPGSRTSGINFSKQFQKDDAGAKRPARFIYRVLKSGEREGLVEVKGEVVLRVTPAGRQRVKALFYVDDRSIDHLLFQRFTTDTETPHELTHFSLRGDEIKKVAGLLKLIESGRFDGPDKLRIEESDLEQFIV